MLKITFKVPFLHAIFQVSKLIDRTHLHQIMRADCISIFVYSGLFDICMLRAEHFCMNKIGLNRAWSSILMVMSLIVNRNYFTKLILGYAYVCHGYQPKHVCLTFYIFALFLDFSSQILFDLNFFDIILLFKGERQHGRERTNSEEVVNSEMKLNSKKNMNI